MFCFFECFGGSAGDGKGDEAEKNNPAIALLHKVDLDLVLSNLSGDVQSLSAKCGDLTSEMRVIFEKITKFLNEHNFVSLTEKQQETIRGMCSALQKEVVGDKVYDSFVKEIEAVQGLIKNNVPALVRS